ncbi:SURF1 family cytochrome oxidase biogenesis protein [Janibacter sp. GS2]|uniref:SURF1 family cytochrome oxidase biogenesis protein n=1 Tax=Janibacter sp. GS2 TaxID=3442646 RepID=UPI003EC0FE05
MLRLLLTPRWLGWLALAVLVALACVWLGQWQWSKYEVRAARADRVEAHYEADPAPATEVLEDDPVALEDEWTRVSTTGRYAGEDQVLVRNRPLDGTYGYEVLVPLRLADGSHLLVDRGWVPNSPKGADVAPVVPPAPEDEVTVTGWVRLGESSLGRDLPAGQVASINLPEVEDEIGSSLLGGYVSLQSETPEAPRPEPLEVPDTSTGSHLPYAIQWWLVVPAVFVFWFVALRREARTGELGAPPEKKVRIWDEEDG